MEPQPDEATGGSEKFPDLSSNGRVGAIVSPASPHALAASGGCERLGRTPSRAANNRGPRRAAPGHCWQHEQESGFSTHLSASPAPFLTKRVPDAPGTRPVWDDRLRVCRVPARTERRSSIWRRVRACLPSKPPVLRKNGLPPCSRCSSTPRTRSTCCHSTMSAFFTAPLKSSTANRLPSTRRSSHTRWHSVISFPLLFSRFF